MDFTYDTPRNWYLNLFNCTVALGLQKYHNFKTEMQHMYEDLWAQEQEMTRITQSDQINKEQQETLVIDEQVEMLAFGSSRIKGDEYRITREKDIEYERYETLRSTLKEPRIDLSQELRITKQISQVHKSQLIKMLEGSLEYLNPEKPIDWSSNYVGTKIKEQLQKRQKYLVKGMTSLFDLELRKIMMADNLKAIKKKIKEISIEKSQNAYELQQDYKSKIVQEFSQIYQEKSIELQIDIQEKYLNKFRKKLKKTEELKKLQNVHIQAIILEIQTKLDKKCHKLYSEVSEPIIEKFRLKCKKICLKSLRNNDEGDLKNE